MCCNNDLHWSVCSLSFSPLSLSLSLSLSQALSKNGKVFAGSMMVAVHPCIEQSVMHDATIKSHPSLSDTPDKDPGSLTTPTRPRGGSMRPLTAAYRTSSDAYEVTSPRNLFAPSDVSEIPLIVCVCSFGSDLNPWGVKFCERACCPVGRVLQALVLKVFPWRNVTIIWPFQTPFHFCFISVFCSFSVFILLAWPLQLFISCHVLIIEHFI